MPFPAFWSGLLCIEQVMNEKKILGSLMKQNLNTGVDLGEGCTGVCTPVGLGQQGCKGGAKNQYYYNRSKCPSL